jgi:NitT/TauT family transport system permease protein
LASCLAEAEEFLDAPRVFAGLVTIAILGMALELLFGLLERRTVLRWGMKTAT